MPDVSQSYKQITIFTVKTLFIYLFIYLFI